MMASALLFAAALMGFDACAQSLTVAAPKFEVAAIHELSPPFRALMTLTVSGTRVSFEGYNVTGLVSEAFGLKDYQVVTASMRPERLGLFYQIEARAPGETAPTKADIRAMLQNLLVDRFQMAVHRETKIMAVYTLVVDRGGPKLKSSNAGGDCRSRIGPVQPEDRNYRYVFTNCTLEPLVNTLQSDRPILDRTGLTGRYDLTLFATPEFKMRDSSEPGDIRFLDAIGQLGLRLDAQKAPIEVLMIDHIEPPSAN